MDNMDHHNIKGRSRERRRAQRERRRRREMRASNISDVLGMTPTKGGNEDMATASALQRARAAAINRHERRPRHMSPMSWYASRAHLVPSPHASDIDWTIDTDSEADDEFDYAEEKERDEDEDPEVYTEDEDAEEDNPKPTQSDIDFIVDPVDEDARDETYVQTDAETAEDDDGVEEELQLALLLSTGRLDRRQSWLAEQRINEIRYNLRSRRRAARSPVREEKENECDMDEKEPDTLPAGEPELPAEAAASHAGVGAASESRSKGESRPTHPNPPAEVHPDPLAYLTPPTGTRQQAQACGTHVPATSRRPV